MKSAVLFLVVISLCCWTLHADNSLFGGLEIPNACLPLSTDLPTEFQLSPGEVTCMSTPSIPTEGAQFRLTIQHDLMGRYEILHIVNAERDNPEDEGLFGMGYAWSEPSSGLYYCVPGDTNITFTDYVEGATMTVDVELVASGEECVSDTISYSGYTPVAVDRDVLPENAAVWSSQRYFLKADYFGYTVAGEETVTLSDAATQVEIGGDPGGDDYHSIEITWLDGNGKQKRFYGYIDSNGTRWNMFQAAIYDFDEDWVEFTLLTDVQGTRGSCFQKRELVLTSTDINMQQSEIRFENLTLATFLPWADQDAMEACIQSEEIPEDSLVVSAENAVTWATPRYYLRAEHFEFTIMGQDTVTTHGFRHIEIDGDPGDDAYMTIEISWLGGNDGAQQRFFAYFESNQTHWNMFEARVRDDINDRWESFVGLHGVVFEKRGECFAQDSLVLTNEHGSEIRFESIILAVFLPWEQPDYEQEEAEQGVMQARNSFSLDKKICPERSPVSEYMDSNGESGAAIPSGDSTTWEVAEDADVTATDIFSSSRNVFSFHLKTSVATMVALWMFLIG